MTYEGIAQRHIQAIELRLEDDESSYRLQRCMAESAAVEAGETIPRMAEIDFRWWRVTIDDRRVLLAEVERLTIEVKRLGGSAREGDLARIKLGTIEAFVHMIGSGYEFAPRSLQSNTEITEELSIWRRFWRRVKGIEKACKA